MLPVWGTKGASFFQGGGRKGGQGQTRSAAGISRRRARSAGIGLNRRARPLGTGQGTQGPAIVEQFGDGMGPDHAALAENAVIQAVRTGHGPGMGKTGLAACFASSHIKGDDRLFQGYFAGGFHKFPSPFNAFQVKGDNFGVRTGPQIFKAVNHVHVGFVAHAESGAEAQVQPIDVIEHLGDKTAALGGQSNIAGGSLQRE